MSVAQLWPSMLSTMQGDSYFWCPVLNDNTDIIDNALSPAVARFRTDEDIHPYMPVALSRDALGYKVSGDLYQGCFCGVTVGAVDGGYVRVMMYGVAPVRISGTMTAADIGKCARFMGHNSGVAPSEDQAHKNEIIGEIVGVDRNIAYVALNYYNSASLINRGFYRNTESNDGMLDPAVFFPGRAPSNQGFREAVVRFSVHSEPFRVVPVSTVRGFHTGEHNYLVAAQLSNGIRLATIPIFDEAFSDVKQRGSTYVRVSGLRCKYTEGGLSIVSSNFYTTVMDTGVVLEAVVQGTTTGKVLT